MSGVIGYVLTDYFIFKFKSSNSLISDIQFFTPAIETKAYSLSFIEDKNRLLEFLLSVEKDMIITTLTR